MHEQGQFGEAEREYRKALQIDPSHAQSHANLAILLLLNGESPEGWREYEWRWQIGVLERSTLTHSTSPVWSGEPLDGKHLLVVGEQGIGEQIMFSTLIPDVLIRGANITFDCDKRLVPLYTRSFPAVRVRPFSEQHNSSTDEFDYHIALGSLSQYFWNSENSPVAHGPILRADPDRVRELKTRYAALGNGPVIGISWRSDSSTYFDQKNVALDQWGPVFEVNRNFTFLSLQYGEAKASIDDARRKLGVHIHHDPAINPINSLEDHAAQIAAVDHVVSISNASVHLAGALGVHCSVLVGDVPLWHWFLENSDSPWYDSVKIFRRNRGEDWRDVIDAVAANLASRYQSE